MCATLAASVAAACAGRAPFRPALASCPPGTRVEQTWQEIEDGGSTYIQHERWCERPDRTRHGPFASWDEPGPSALQGQFRDGKRHGLWIQHYWGRKAEEGVYADGKKEGRWLTYHERGIMNVWTFRAGALHGPARSHCMNGVVDREGAYRDSAPDGRWIWRFCSGRIKEIGWYRAGREVGVWTFYDESGRKRRVRGYPER